MTEVFFFDTDGADLADETAVLLPPWRRERWERLRYVPARRESLAAGLLYAWAMARHGVSRDAAVDILPAGKPVLAGREDLYFSLSHSGRYALCAVGPSPVGADVQLIRGVRPSVARRFHPAEQAWLAGQEDWAGSFFRLWTRKEAWVKAVSGDHMLSLSESNVMSPLPGLWFRDCALPGGYAAAVCAGEPDIAPPAAVAAKELLAALAV